MIQQTTENPASGNSCVNAPSQFHLNKGASGRTSSTEDEATTTDSDSRDMFTQKPMSEREKELDVQFEVIHN